jgi:hypothetical protein
MVYLFRLAQTIKGTLFPSTPLGMTVERKLSCSIAVMSSGVETQTGYPLNFEWSVCSADCQLRIADCLLPLPTGECVRYGRQPDRAILAGARDDSRKETRLRPLVGGGCSSETKAFYTT